MAEYFTTGRAVDGILALMLLEAAVLLIIGRTSRRGLPPLQLMVNLGAGAALLLALRAALLGAPWQHISLWLIAALIAHVIDLHYRWNIAQRTRSANQRVGNYFRKS